MYQSLVSIFALGFATTAACAIGETWVPVNDAAQSITGRVVFLPDRITFQNKRSLDIKQFGGVLGSGMRVYKVLHPQDPVLIGGNKLCGMAPVTFITVTPSGSSRDVSVFTTVAAPDQNASPCGNYGYEVRGAPHSTRASP